MTPEALFLQRCEQIQLLLESHREIELLDLGGLLRQLLCDKRSLADTVNTNKVPLTFKTGQFREPPSQNTAFLLLEDGLDPETRPPGAPSADLSKEEFLSHVVLCLHGRSITIKEVIRFASNVAGGIHHDPKPKTEYEALAQASKLIEVGGLPLSIRQLKAIARVTMRALEPLVEDVRRRSA